MVATPIKPVDDRVGIGNHLAQGVDEEKLTVGHGTTQIHRSLEVGELVDDMIDLNLQLLVDDDAETAFRFHMIDKQDDRPPEVEVVH